MTKPTMIFFGPDGPSGKFGSHKIYLRTLLYCTAKRGRVVESLYVTVRLNESRQNFSIWVLGEEKLSRGSGIFVPEQGIVTNHHFLLPFNDSQTFHFREGDYYLQVYAKVLGSPQAKMLFEQTLSIDRSLAEGLTQDNKGVYFD